MILRPGTIQVHLTVQRLTIRDRAGDESMWIRTLQQGKRFLKIVFGFTLLALGLIMILTPGPGWLTILLGLGVLAAEFVWARRLLDRLKAQGGRLRDAVLQRQPVDRN
ncbi:MAG: PGPGW domain-containing protein [Candidatus Acidiferrales bacterium]